MLPAIQSFEWLQVHAASFSHAAIQAAMLALAESTSVRGQRGSSGGNPGLSNVGGDLVNLTASVADGFATENLF